MFKAMLKYYELKNKFLLFLTYNPTKTRIQNFFQVIYLGNSTQFKAKKKNQSHFILEGIKNIQENSGNSLPHLWRQHTTTNATHSD